MVSIVKKETKPGERTSSNQIKIPDLCGCLQLPHVLNIKHSLNVIIIICTTSGMEYCLYYMLYLLLLIGGRIVNCT